MNKALLPPTSGEPTSASAVVNPEQLWLRLADPSVSAIDGIALTDDALRLVAVAGFMWCRSLLLQELHVLGERTKKDYWEMTELVQRMQYPRGV